jgi:predicted secreted protein
MDLAFAIAIYLVVWWIVLFTVLPVGVRSQQEEGEVVPGSAESAPMVPRLLAKVVATTVIASAVFAVIYAVIAHELITLDEIPFLPRYETVR